MDAIPPEPSRHVAPGLGVSNGIMPTIRERLQGTAERRAFIVVLLVLGILFPLIDGNEGDIDAAANALAFATLALGLNITVGYAGLLDLGYAAFFAIGAYTYGMLASPQFNIHLPFWVLLVVAAALAALFGLLLGTPTLRLRGDYLAIVTLGFGLIVPQILQNLTKYTGGPNGISALDIP